MPRDIPTHSQLQAGRPNPFRDDNPGIFFRPAPAHARGLQPRNNTQTPEMLTRSCTRSVARIARIALHNGTDLATAIAADELTRGTEQEASIIIRIAAGQLTPEQATADDFDQRRFAAAAETLAEFRVLLEQGLVLPPGCPGDIPLAFM